MLLLALKIYLCWALICLTIAYFKGYLGAGIQALKFGLKLKNINKE